MSIKKKIAIITNSDDDVYCFRKELIDGFIDNGFDVIISCPYGEKIELVRGGIFYYDDCIIDRRGTNLIKDYKLLKHYIKLFKKQKPDIVLTFTAKPNVYASIAARRFKIPYVCNVTGLGSVIKKRWIVRKLIFRLFKKAYRNALCVMFQNSVNLELALKNKMVKDNNYKLIPGSGVNLERFAVQPYPSGGDGINGETIVFNYIGRIFSEKGVDDYISAAKEIKKNFPKTEFNMIGFVEPTEKHYLADLKKYEQEGIICYKGNQKDVRPYIKRSHAIIHPSIYGEGMSNVLLENAASGRPIITTNNPGCAETVEDGVSGFIYKGGDTDGLINVIKHFITCLSNEQREFMGLQGRKKVEIEFDRKIVLKAYLEIISNE